MIFLDYLYNLPNDTSVDKILISTTTEINGFVPLLLVFVWFIVFLGGIGRQKMRIGTADYSLWSVVASICTLIIALIMSIPEGMMNLLWLVVVVVVTIFSSVWFFLDKKSQEV